MASDYQLSLAFDGRTFNASRDGFRLAAQLDAVFHALSDGTWWTLADLASAAHGSTAAVSARVRDLRKARWGKHEIQRRYLADGVWVYRHALEVCCG